MALAAIPRFRQVWTPRLVIIWGAYTWSSIASVTSVDSHNSHVVLGVKRSTENLVPDTLTKDSRYPG
jgi:hypothetical protein